MDSGPDLEVSDRFWFGCVQQCQQPIQQEQQIQQQEMQQFQDRLQRCARACQDKVEDQMPADKSMVTPLQQNQLQQSFNNCAVKCVQDQQGMLPKLKATLETQVKQAGAHIPSN